MLFPGGSPDGKALSGLSTGRADEELTHRWIKAGEAISEAITAAVRQAEIRRPWGPQGLPPGLNGAGVAYSFVAISFSVARISGLVAL